MSDRILKGLFVLVIVAFCGVLLDRICSKSLPRGSVAITHVRHVAQYVESTFIKSGDVLIPITTVHPEHWIGTASIDGREVSVSAEYEIKPGETVTVDEIVGTVFHFGYRVSQDISPPTRKQMPQILDDGEFRPLTEDEFDQFQKSLKRE